MLIPFSDPSTYPKKNPGILSADGNLYEKTYYSI